MIKIDKGVPLPDRSPATGLTDVMRKLKVGDSFVYDKLVRSGVYALAKRLGISVAVRNEDDGNVRVWRIK